MHILIAEDDSDMQKISKLYLQKDTFRLPSGRRGGLKDRIWR